MSTSSRSSNDIPRELPGNQKDGQDHPFIFEFDKSNYNATYPCLIVSSDRSPRIRLINNNVPSTVSGHLVTFAPTIAVRVCSSIITKPSVTAAFKSSENSSFIFKPPER